MKEDNSRILQAYLSELRSFQSKSLGKYQRNINRYYNSISSHILNLRSSIPVGFNALDPTNESDIARVPNLNVIKSIIDTLVSKIATVKVRPFFTPIQGDYQTIKILRQVQTFFDDYLDRQDINKKISFAFRDACIFDTGVLFVDPYLATIHKLNPWQCTLMGTEYNYGNPLRCLLTFDDYPTSFLNKYGIDRRKNQVYCKFEIYFDVEYHKAEFYIDGIKAETKTYKPDELPIVLLHYTSPIKGERTSSIVDDLNSIQENINVLASKIYTAAELTPANTIFVPEGSNISVENMTNRIGQILKYKPIPNLAEPVIVASPAFINPEYTQLLDYYIKKAYEIVGVSELSALGKKPQGIDSGRAMESMENIESDRFETQLNACVRAYVDISKMMIAIMPEDQDILPKEMTRSKLTWKQVKKESSLINIQYSAQTLLSKDPSIRLEQIMKMATVGLIPQGQVARYLEMPDINEAYNLATASQMACEQIIEDVLTKMSDMELLNYEVPVWVDSALLEGTIVTLQNQLYAAGDNKKYQERLMILLAQCEKKLMKMGATPIPLVSEDKSYGITPQGEEINYDELATSPGTLPKMNPEDLNYEELATSPGNQSPINQGDI